MVNPPAPSAPRRSAAPPAQLDWQTHLQELTALLPSATTQAAAHQPIPPAPPAPPVRGRSTDHRRQVNWLRTFGALPPTLAPAPIAAVQSTAPHHPALLQRLSDLFNKHLPTMVEQQPIYADLMDLVRASQSCFHGLASAPSGVVQEQALQQLACDVTAGAGRLNLKAAERLAVHAGQPLGRALTALGYLVLADRAPWVQPRAAQATVAQAQAQAPLSNGPDPHGRLAAYTERCFPQPAQARTTPDTSPLHLTLTGLIDAAAQDIDAKRENHKHISKGRYSQQCVFATLAYIKLASAMCHQYPQQTAEQQGEFAADMRHLGLLVSQCAAKYKRAIFGYFPADTLNGPLQTQFRVFGVQHIALFQGITDQLVEGGMTKRFAVQLLLEFSRWTESYLKKNKPDSDLNEPGAALQTMNDLFFGADEARNTHAVMEFTDHVTKELRIYHGRSHVEKFYWAWKLFILEKASVGHA
jgi:hypothetical protein